MKSTVITLAAMAFLFSSLPLSAQAPSETSPATPAAQVQPGTQPSAGQPPAGRGRGGGRGGPALSVRSTAWPDGGEIPAPYSLRGGNRSPAFEFNWVQGLNPAEAPANLASYAIVFRDLDVASGRGPNDFLHWTVFNIPPTAKGVAEALPPGDLPDGSRQGPGFRTGEYAGPGAGVGPQHHYVFDFYALDTKLDLPPTATRQQLMAAMEGHVIAKHTYVGRFSTPPPAAPPQAAPPATK